MVLALAVIAGALPGCGDEPLPASVESICGGLCQGAARCSATVSRARCDSGCIGDTRNIRFLHIRPDAAAVIGACVAAEDCGTILNGGPFNDCWNRAGAELAPSPHLLEFCPGYATSVFECGYSYSVEDCRIQMNIWIDDFLDDLTACTQESTCDAEDVCLDALFGNN